MATTPQTSLQDKVNAESTLYGKVQAWNSADSGKSKIGYAVSTYGDVLDALKKAKIVIERKVNADNAVGGGGGPNGQQISRDYSTSVDDSWGQGDVNNNGFIFNSSGSAMYQGVTKICDFMSFPVDYQSPTQGALTLAVEVTRPSQRKADDICLLGKKQPPSKMDKVSIQRTQTELGGSNFVIGVGIDLATFGVQFFKTYFPQGSSKWTHDNLKALAAARKLYAEISVSHTAVAIGQTSSATAFHAMVSCDIGDELGGTSDNQMGGVFKVWLPYPLMLLNDYRGVANVSVNGALVGTGSVSYPLANSKYNHKKGQIYDFSPSWCLNYMKFNGKFGYDNMTCDLIHGGVDRQARVRLYLDKDAATIVNGLPDNAELFKGKHEVIKQEFIQGAISGALPNGTFRVLIDVGHGNWRRPEYTYNLDISEKVKQELQRRGVGVTLLDAESPLAAPDIASALADYRGQTSQATYNLKERDAVLAIINQRANDYQCFISIHCDATKGGTGAHVVYNTATTGGYSEKCKLLAQHIGKLLTKVMGKTGGKTGTDSFGAGIRNDLGILKTNKIPGCLIECGFYDNPKDLQKIKNPTEIVQAICDGIVNWFNNMSI